MDGVLSKQVMPELELCGGELSVRLRTESGSAYLQIAESGERGPSWYPVDARQLVGVLQFRSCNVPMADGICSVYRRGERVYFDCHGGSRQTTCCDVAASEFEATLKAALPRSSGYFLA